MIHAACIALHRIHRRGMSAGKELNSSAGRGCGRERGELQVSERTRMLGYVRGTMDIMATSAEGLLRAIDLLWCLLGRVRHVQMSSDSRLVM